MCLKYRIYTVYTVICICWFWPTLNTHTPQIAGMQCITSAHTHTTHTHTHTHTHTTNCRHAVYHKCTYTHYSQTHTHTHTHTHTGTCPCSVGPGLPPSPFHCSCHSLLKTMMPSQVHIHTLLTHSHTHHKLQACGVPQEPAHGRTCRGFRTHAAAARWHHGVHGCRSTRHRHPRHHPRGSGEKKRMLASVTHAQGLHHGVHGCRSTGHRHPRRHPRGSGEKRRMLASVTHARTRLASWYGCCSTGHRHPRHHPRGSGEKRRMLASVTHV